MSNFEKKARKARKQTRLTFDPIDRASSPASKMSPARVRYGLPGRAQTPLSSNGFRDAEETVRNSISTRSKALPTPAKSSQPVLLDDSDTEDEIITSSTRSRKLFARTHKPAQRKIDFNVSDRSGHSKANNNTQNVPQVSGVVELSSDSSSEDIFDLPPPTSARKPVVSITNKDEDSDDAEPIASPKRQRPIPIDDDDEDSDIVSSPLKRRKLVYQSVDSRSLDTEDSDAQVSSPPKRRRHQGSQADSDGENTRYTRQSKIRRHRTEKEKTLELLKRKRAGENIDALTESESESDNSEDPELQELSEFDDESEEEVQPEVPKKKNPPTKNTNTEDAGDSDFLDDDEDENLGVPDPSLMRLIPLEFTSASHKPLKEHFRDAIEWMVQKKINPGFDRDDPIYVHAFRKLDDEYGGYAKSKFVSSQWTAEFTRALYARPYLELKDLAPGEGVNLAGEPICEVCNHRKHISTFQLQFKGKAYHVETLEEVDDEDEDDDDDGDDHKSYNAEGQELPSQEKQWKSGRFCKANAEQAHTLIHWKFSLYEWVVGQLEIEGYLTPEKLAEREKMKSKQRREYANNIVDIWEASRQIRELYRDFKNQLEGAREAKQYSGGGRWGRK